MKQQERKQRKIQNNLKKEKMKDAARKTENESKQPNTSTRFFQKISL